MSSYGASHTRTAIKKEKKGKITNNLGHNHSRVRNGVVRGKYTAAGASTRIVKQRALSYTHTHARVRSERKGLTCFPPAACYARGEHTVGRLICESCHHCVPHRLSLSGVHRPAISTAFAAAGLIRHPSQNTAAHLIDLGCWLTSGHPHTESPVAKI